MNKATHEYAIEQSRPRMFSGIERVIRRPGGVSSAKLKYRVMLWNRNYPAFGGGFRFRIVVVRRP